MSRTEISTIGEFGLIDHINKYVIRREWTAVLKARGNLQGLHNRRIAMKDQLPELYGPVGP